jgi:hypothetical protein
MIVFAHPRAAVAHLLFMLTIVFARALILREPASLLLGMSPLLFLYVDATGVAPRVAYHDVSLLAPLLSLPRYLATTTIPPLPPLLPHSPANTVVVPVTSGVRFVINKLGDGHMIWWIHVW